MGSFYNLASSVVRRIYDRRIDTPPVLDPQMFFPNFVRYAERWRELRDEALQIACELHKVPRFHDLMQAQADISDNDGREWRMFIVKAYGVRIEDNLGRCPTLSRLLEQTPEVSSACFSFVAPHKHIPLHRGPFRGILRFHLGLSVPFAADGRPGTVLTIDGVDHRIGDGDTLLWDDTCLHELRNDADQVRVALLLDVRRPGMPLDMQLLSGMLMHGTAGVIRARRSATPYLLG